MTVILKETTMNTWNFRGHSVITLGLLATAILFAPVGNATMLAPGATTGPPTQDFSSAIFAGATDAMLGPIAVTSNPVGSFTGSLEQWVLTDSVTGGLDFIYQVSYATTSSDGLLMLSTTNFTGFTTDVGYCSNAGGAFPCTDILAGAPAGSVAPSTIDRSVAGNVVGFNFAGAGVAPGAKSYDLVIKTNATSFGLIGNTQVIDGGVFTTPTYAPTPEPGSVGLLLGGLFGAGLFVTRKFRAQRQS